MGHAALYVAFVAAVAGLLVGRFRADLERRFHVLAVALIAIAVLRAAWLLAVENTSYALVVDNTRPGLSLIRRVMGLWGGSSGSLLFFALVIGAVLVVAPVKRQLLGLPSVVLVALSGATLFVGRPFDKLDTPAIAGSGISPILEHWAMIIHPPLLYLGLALALAPALVDPAEAARWSRAAVATLTIALALGGGWAYVELGWGGWWAWDPVENVALIPWLLLVSTFHSGVRHVIARWAFALVWPAVFAGTAMTRTSLRTSVHAFADADGLGWWLWPLAGIAAIASVVLARKLGDQPSLGLPKRLPSMLLVATAIVVALGTFRPGLEGVTAGSFFARYLFPVTIIGLAAMGVVPYRGQRRRAALIGSCLGGMITLGWAWAASWTTWWQLMLAAAVGISAGGTMAGELIVRAPRRLARAIAHLGVALVLAGALGGTASTTQTIGLSEGAALDVAGHRFENLGARFLGEDPPVIGASVLLDDAELLEPSIAVYVERRLRLPEVATHRTLLEDVQVILRDADDDGSATITINTEPLTQFVWIGATLIAASALLAGSRSRTGRSNQGQDTPTQLRAA